MKVLLFGGTREHLSYLLNAYCLTPIPLKICCVDILTWKNLKVRRAVSLKDYFLTNFLKIIPLLVFNCKIYTPGFNKLTSIVSPSGWLFASINAPKVL